MGSTNTSALSPGCRRGKDRWMRSSSGWGGRPATTIMRSTPHLAASLFPATRAPPAQLLARPRAQQPNTSMAVDADLSSPSASQHRRSSSRPRGRRGQWEQEEAAAEPPHQDGLALHEPAAMERRDVGSSSPRRRRSWPRRIHHFAGQGGQLTKQVRPSARPAAAPQDPLLPTSASTMEDLHPCV